MSENKTQPTKLSVEEFLGNITIFPRTKSRRKNLAIEEKSSSRKFFE
ncbi:MAG: hypothetical protein N4A45_07605 [Flavobacteriales bacterium]|jgi:hypothetical protein|nr:hypothetical protein [Flavobacteriales bacterium]